MARRSSLFGDGLPSVGSSTVQSMVADVKYPFAGLAVKVGGDVGVSGESNEWAEIAAKNEKQLDGIWLSLEREARHLLQLLVAAPEAPPDEPPNVEISIDII